MVKIMEHTIEAYIERCSSLELLNFLEFCMIESQWAYHAHIIPHILLTLEKRDISLPEQIRAAWDMFCEK